MVNLTSQHTFVKFDSLKIQLTPELKKIMLYKKNLLRGNIFQTINSLKSSFWHIYITF